MVDGQICTNRIEFTQLAADYKAVNLGQGFPDFSPPKFIQEAFCKAVCGGPIMHQYTRAFVSGNSHLVTVLSFSKCQRSMLVFSSCSKNS